MQPAVQAVELILLVGKLLVGRVREEDDPLMAAAGDAHQPTSLTLQYSDISPNTLKMIGQSN